MGMGGGPDADKFGDLGSDTLGHIAERMDGLSIPNFTKIGLANLKPMQNCPPAAEPIGYYCALTERSAGKDTMTGHWEIMGLETKKPFIP